jgi:hypothetical protein
MHQSRVLPCRGLCARAYDRVHRAVQIVSLPQCHILEVVEHVCTYILHSNTKDEMR